MNGLEMSSDLPFDFLVMDYQFRRSDRAEECVSYVGTAVRFDVMYDERDGLAVTVGRLAQQNEAIPLECFLGALERCGGFLDAPLFPRRWPSPVVERLTDMVGPLRKFGRGLILGDRSVFEALIPVALAHLSGSECSADELDGLIRAVRSTLVE